MRLLVVYRLLSRQNYKIVIFAPARLGAKLSCGCGFFVSIWKKGRVFSHNKKLGVSGKVICVKGALSGLTQVLATESPLKMVKNAFYFILKAPFILKIFKLLSWLFGHV